MQFAPPLSAEGKVSESADGLQGVIRGSPMFGSVNVYLKQSQEVVADYGSLLWMNDGAMMTTGMYGDCTSAMGRSCAGESCCMNTYTAGADNVVVGFGFLLPGDMVLFGVSPDNGWILSQGAFVAGSTNLRISGRFAGCCASQFSGEGMFLTKITMQDNEGNGQFFAGGYGGIDRHEIASGNVFMIDNGMFFAGDDKLKLRVGFVGSSGGGGCMSTFFSGEGMVMMIRGPAVVYTQNRDPSIFKPPQDQTAGAE